MSFCNGSDTEDDHISLLQRISSLEKQLDAKNQELYDIQNKVSFASLLKEDCSSEIEAIRLSGMENESKLLREIKTLNEALKALYDNSDEIEQTKLINDLENQKMELQCCVGDVEKKSDESLRSVYAVEEAQQVHLIEVQEKIDSLSNEYISLQVKEKELEKLTTENNHILTSIKEELYETRNETKHLEDQYNSFKLKVDSFTREPSAIAPQGNSLFAEIYDSEIKLRTAISKLEKCYLEIKSRYSCKLTEIKSISVNNMELCTALDSINECDIVNDRSIKELKSKVSDQQLVHLKFKMKIESDFQVKPNDLPKYANDFGTAAAKEKWNEVMSDIESLNMSYLERLDNAVKLTQIKQKIRKSVKEVLQQKVKLEELRHTLLELQSSANIFDNMEGAPMLPLKIHSVEKT